MSEPNPTDPPKPLLVGMTNPYGAEPEFALYPKPEKSAGGRLCYDILGFKYAQEYLRAFDRTNLCIGAWSLKVAREKASLLRAVHMGPIILLGEQVTKAFHLPFTPFTVQRSFFGSKRDIFILPHPSGRCRLWNDPLSTAKARELLKEFI